MKKRLFTFFCTMAVLLFSQSAWAAQGDATINKLSQSNARLNSIVGNNYEYTTEDGFMKVVITGEHAVAYSTEGDACQDVAKLTFGHVKGNEKFNFKFQVSKPGAGYELTLISARTLTKMVGTYGYYALGNHNEELINNTAGAWTDQKVTYTALTTEIPFYFRGGSARIGGNLGVGACMEKYELEYLVVPNAPTWNPATDNVKVTVNHTQDAYLHWIDLSNYIQVANDAFKGTVKYEAVGLDAKYIIWNADSTKCYIIKPGTYQFRAYVDKKDGVYCSSAYTATNLQLTAASDPAEQANAQIFYMVNNVLATEVDPLNHVWETSVVSGTTNNNVEFIYGYEGDLKFEQRTEFGITYLTKTENRKDNFNVGTIGGRDSVIVTNADGGARSWLRINSQKADNHVTFTIGSEKMFNALVTSVSTQEGKDVFWDNNRIRFAHFNSNYSRERKMEITFTGIPDSLIMLYGNNAEQQVGNTNLRIEYYDGASWSTLVTIPGRPNSDVDQYVRFAYALKPNVSMLRFSYWGAQNLGFIHNLTVTERKGFTMNVPCYPAENSTVFISGRHGQGVVYKDATLNWYNLAPALCDTMVAIHETDVPKAFNATISGAKPLALDQYQENIPVKLGLKTDSAGTFAANYMVWNGKRDMSEVAGGKAVYGIRLVGVVGYNSDEIKIENNLPSDTVLAKQDTLIELPLNVVDTLGNELPKDSINFVYEFDPEQSAEFDSISGKIKVNCVGYTRVIAKLQENLLVPGGLSDTLYIYVPEEVPNKIVLNIPAEVGVNQVLTNVATTLDGADMSYTFIPADGGIDLGNNTIQMGPQSGVVTVKAKAAMTCDHFAMDSIFQIKVLDVLDPDKNITINPAAEKDNLTIGDSIVDLVVVKDNDGKILTEPDVKIEYIISPDNTISQDSNVLHLDHAADPATIIVKITGDTIATYYDTIKIKINPLQETVEYVDMPDTLFVGQEYDFADYTVTNSGNVIDAVNVKVVPFSFQTPYTQDGTKVTANEAFTARIIVTANGNADYAGPAYDTAMVAFVVAVKQTDWEDALKPLDLEDLKIIDDTIPTSNVPILDEKGNDISNLMTKTYDIIPNPDGDAEVTPQGDIVITKPGDVMVIITTSGFGYETKIDTLYLHGEGYEVGTVDLGADLSNVHVGDTISMDNVTVYDVDGKDITDTKVEDITYVIEPSDAAKYDPATNSIIVLKAEEFSIIPVVSGARLDPNPATDTIPVEVKNYTGLQIEFPTKPGDDYLPGDTINLKDIVIKDENGKDITDLCDPKITWEPEENAHLDDDGNLIIDKGGDLDIKVEITGEGIDSTELNQTVPVQYIEIGRVDYPNKPDDGYHVGDVIDTDEIRIYDKDGNDITDKADIEFTFVPSDAAHIDPKTGDIVIDKSGDVVIQTNIGGGVVEEKVDEEEIYVKKYTTDEIIIPEEPIDSYEPGDKILLDSIQVLDKDGNDITDLATITITWDPEENAHLDPKGNIVFDKPGRITVTTCVSGEGLTEKCIENTYIIRHNEDGCYNLLTQVWDDVLAVNNNEELHVRMGLPMFVSYQWYREEELLAGETNQDYHISAEEFKDSANFYVRATGTNGKEYLICGMWINETSAPKASASFKVYPTMVSNGDKYTVEVFQAGTIYVTTSNGQRLNSYPVNAGKNVATAPAADGVYVLQFAPVSGNYEVQKLIVK